MAVEVTREQALAYRLTAQGLTARDAGKALELAVLDLGAQDTPAGSARLVLSTRLAEPLPPDDGYLDGLSMTWTHRGAPHLHRSADLAALAVALWPRGDADAARRLGAPARTLKEAGIPALDALRWTAEAVAEVVTAPTTKGELSGQVTRLIPDELSAWCRGCQATHVSDQMLRLATLPGGARMVPGSSPVTFVPVEGWPGVPRERAGTAAVARAYLRLLGPAGPSEVAGFLGTSAKELAEAWPADELTEVRVDGRRAWIARADMPALRAAARPKGVVFVPPGDPYLQARDRDLALPEKAHQKVVYRILGNPGAVIVDGEIAGIWRAKSAGKRLEITVTPFASLPAKGKENLDDEATRIATARGHTSATVSLAA